MTSQASYKTIARTTGVIGGVQVFQMAFGLLRNKALAIMVGAQGFGAWGLYNAYVEMMSQFSVFGLDQSGVRQIAKNSADADSVGKTIYVCSRAILLATLLVTVAAVAGSAFVSRMLFGEPGYAVGLALASLAILFNGLFKRNTAILTGLSQVRSVALSQIIGAIAGSFVAVALVYFLRHDGIAAYVLAVPVIAAITTGYFVRRTGASCVTPTFEEGTRELSSLLSIGLGFSATGIISAVMTYCSRSYLISTYSMDTVGIYQASWTISNLYIGVILSAMGVDLMPRLMRVHRDDAAMNRLVNEQMELGTLAASVGVVAILVCSPLLLRLLYSAEFTPGTAIIRWQVLGVSLRVLAFPFSYAIMAKGKTAAYVAIQFAFWITEYLLLVLCSRLFGFDGLGINYVAGYLIYLALTFFACRRIFGFRSSRLLSRVLLVSYAPVATTFALSFWLAPRYSIPLGGCVLLLHALVVHRELRSKMQIDLFQLLKNRVRVDHP